MFRRVFLAGLVFAPLCVSSLPAYAASGTGDMKVGILDPVDLSLDEAKKLCEEQPLMIKCDTVREQVEEEQSDFVPVNYSNDNFFLDSEEVLYRVFNANYE